jgi:hypothetical protein
VVIGSVVIDLPHAFLTVAEEVKAGTFTPRVVSFGAKSDVVRWIYNPAFRDSIPATTLARVDSVSALLKSGTLSLR